MTDTPSFQQEWVDAYFNNGVDIANRRVFIGDMDEISVDCTIKGLYLMETQSKVQPCEMFISSLGGTVHDTLALYDIINTLHCPIHTFAYGKCMSAAPLLLAAGNPGNRWIAPHASFMHHDWSDHVAGKGSELEAIVKHNEWTASMWTTLLAKHSTKNFQWWNTRAKQSADFYFYAEEAIDWGIADHIWVEK